ncbi:hypothetical protein [Streptomyces neyagawaensis]
MTDRGLDVVRLVASKLKLAARNRVEIAAWAWRMGLVGDHA